MTDGADPGAATQGVAEVVAPVAELGFAGVHRDPHPQLSTFRPDLSRKCPLHGDRCRHGIRRPAERPHDAVALALLHRPHTTMASNGLIEQPVVPGDGHRHRLRRRLPTGRGPFDVAQQERDCARRQRKGVILTRSGHGSLNKQRPAQRMTHIIDHQRSVGSRRI